MASQKVAMVAGGAGGIGEGIVKALIANDYLVYVPTRAGDNSDRLRAYVGASPLLKTIAADLCHQDQVDALRAQIIADVGRLDAVVVSVGAYYYGHRMHRMPREDWENSIADNLATHFNLQRAFVDQLRSQNGGTYAVLVGPEAESIHPEEGVVSIMATAQKTMTRVIAQEAFDSNVRVHAITAHTTIKTRSRGANTNPDWINADDLGRYVAALIAGRVPGAQQTEHDLRNRAHVEALLK